MKNSSNRKKIVMDGVMNISIPEEFVEEADNFRKMLLYYKCAIKEVQTKLEILNDELASNTSRNPIEYISSRVKSTESIIGKLQRKGYPLNVESAWKYLNDIAGLRVICAFIEDIYDVADMLTSQDDITVIEIKDYIKNPKENGYRSLHLIVSVPVFLSEKTLDMRVEVQIRTIAMDFWASLEHQVRYKKDIKETEIISKQLKECAETISVTDQKMQHIYHMIRRSK